MDKKILMIGVSTAQNTTNVLPALQMKIDYFVSIETSAAKSRAWSEGMNSVLRDKGVSVLSSIELKKNEDSRIDLISKKLVDIIPNDVEVLWNLGGGQKAQQFALWKTFMDRVKLGKDEIACYANPETKKLDIWEYEDGNLVYYSDSLDSTLTASDIFKIYGFDTHLNDSDLFFKDGKSLIEKKGYSALLDFRDFREFFFRLPTTSYANEDHQKCLTKNDFIDLAKKINDADLKKLYKKERIKSLKNGQALNEEIIIPKLRKKIIEKIKEVFNKPQEIKNIPIYDTRLTNLIKSISGKELNAFKVSLPFFHDIFPSHRRISFLFEDILKEKMSEMLDGRETNIHEAYSNVKIKKNGVIVGEYDILLVSKWGTIVAIDAKTFDVKIKDIDARVLKLRQGAGRYIDFIIVFPFYAEDMERQWFPKELVKLPEKLEVHDIGYYVLTNDKEDVPIVGSSKMKSYSTLLESLGFIKE